MNVKPDKNYKYNMNRKARRSFNKLSEEEKAKIIHDQVVSKVQETVGKEVRDAFLAGVQYEGQHLYQKYVSQIDNAGEDAETGEIVEKLLSDIRHSHLMYVKNHPDTVENK